MKDNLAKVKELWKIPRYKAIIKLVLYLLFFALVFGILAIANLFSSHYEEPIEETSKKTSLENYLEMDNYEYTYTIKTETKTGTIEQLFTGIKFEDIHELTYLNTKYMIKEGKLYHKETNQEIDQLTKYDLMNLEPEHILELISSAKVEETTTTYLDQNLKKEYTLIFEDYQMYLTLYDNGTTITKVNLDVSEYIRITNREITRYVIEINYLNIDNIRSYD